MMWASSLGDRLIIISLKNDTSMSNCLTKLFKVYSYTIIWKSSKQANTVLVIRFKVNERFNWKVWREVDDITNQQKKMDKTGSLCWTSIIRNLKSTKIDMLNYHSVYSVKGNGQADLLAAALMETLSLQWPPEEHWKCWQFSLYGLLKRRHSMWAFIVVVVVTVCHVFISLITHLLKPVRMWAGW